MRPTPTALVASALALAALPLTHAHGAAPGPLDPAAVTVAIIDTGLFAPHPEFDYDPSISGPNGQLVAWWDFTAEPEQRQPGTTDRDPSQPSTWLPGPGETWDTDALPNDRQGHGTATAGMAVGRNADPAKNVAACSGCNLAVAKVGNAYTGNIEGNLTEALRWAVEEVGADVVSMSIGAAAPNPGLLNSFHEAAEEARSQGVLVVVSNGNGWGNAGGPGQPATITPFGDSPAVLSVGADDSPYEFLVSTDPEVVADFRVRSSRASATTPYGSTAGTSFSAPYVAGVAARLVAEQRAAGCQPPAGLNRAEYTELLVKRTARDTVTPPPFEGYGVVDAATLDAALVHAAACTLPPAGDPVSELYVEQGSGTVRHTWSETLDGDLPVHPYGAGRHTRVFAESARTGQTPAGVIGVSDPAGAADGEVYEITLAPGQTRTVTVAWADETLLNDLDLHAFEAPGPLYLPGDAVAASTAGRSAESVTLTNGSSAPATYRVLVVGWTVRGSQPFTITGSGPGPAFDGTVAVQQLF